MGAGGPRRPARQGSRGAAPVSRSGPCLRRRAERRGRAAGVLPPRHRQRRGGVLLPMRLRGGLPVSVPRAPEQDGAVVAVPPLNEIGPLLDGNRRSLARAVPGLFGRDWAELRRSARAQVVAAARAYLGDHGEPLLADAGAESLLLAGHQPELFHPGVWVKHFA